LPDCFLLCFCLANSLWLPPDNKTTSHNNIALHNPTALRVMSRKELTCPVYQNHPTRSRMVVTRKIT
jgi:hypothetical protein